MWKTVIKFLLIIFIILDIILLSFTYHRLKYNSACTVGVVTGYSTGGQSARKSIYEYLVENKTYSNQYFGYNESYLNRNYLVLYDKSNPARSIIYLEYPQDGQLGNEVDNCKKDKLIKKIFMTGWNYIDMYFK